MTRNKRLLSLAMAGALLGAALPEALAGDMSISLSGGSANFDVVSGSKASSEKKSEKKSSSKSVKDTSDEKAEKKGSSKVSLSLSISKPGGLSSSGGAWQVDPAKVGSITLSWKCKGDCDEFEVSVSGGVYNATTGDTSVKLSVSDLAPGKYTATVKAMRDGKSVAKEKLSFKILAREAAEEAQPAAEAEPEPAETEAPADEAAEPVEAEDATEQPTAADEVEDRTEQTAEPVESGDIAEDASIPVEVEEAVEDTAEPVEAEEAAEDAAEPVEAEEAVEDAAEPAYDGEADETAESDVDAGKVAEPVESGEVTEPVDAEEVTAESVESAGTVETENATEETGESQEAAGNLPGEQPEAVEQAEDPVEAEPSEQPVEPQEPQAPEPTETPQAAVPEDGVEIEIEETRAEPEPKAETDDEEVLAVEAPELEDAGTNDAEADEANAPATAEAALETNAGKGEEKAEKKVTLSVTGMQGLTLTDGAVHIDPTLASAATFVWQYSGDCDEYAVVVSGGVYSATTKDKSLKLPLASLAAGSYAVSVTAYRDGKELSAAKLAFFVDASDSAPESGLSLAVSEPQGLLITEGAYQVDPLKVEALTLAWQFGGECDGYAVEVSGGAYSGRTDECSLTLPLKGLEAGAYTVTVDALSGDESVARAQLAFVIASQSQESEGEQSGEPQEGEQQGEQQGGKPQGGGSKGGGSGAKGGDGASEEEQGFIVTPGEALVNTHTSGNRDMSLYGAIPLTLDSEGPMTRLTLGGITLDIRLSDDGPFTASFEEDALALTPQGEGRVWLLNGFALKTLALSGVSTLRLALDGGMVDFPTEPALTGVNYGTLRAAGWASADYCYAVAVDGVTLSVADQTYAMTEEGELI